MDEIINLSGKAVQKVVFNSKGFKALLTSEEMKKAVDSVGQQIAQDAGDGFTAHPFLGSRAGRWMVTVDADTEESREAEAADKVLSRAYPKQRSIT